MSLVGQASELGAELGKRGFRAVRLPDGVLWRRGAVNVTLRTLTGEALAQVMDGTTYLMRAAPLRNVRYVLAHVPDAVKKLGQRGGIPGLLRNADAQRFVERVERTVRQIDDARSLNAGAVNMSADELAAWRARGTWRLAGTTEGHRALRELEAAKATPPAQRTERHKKRLKKASAFFARHSAQSPLFGGEVGRSGYSARHIGFLNWGHDPTKPSSSLYEQDQDWLYRHPGAAARRRM